MARIKAVAAKRGAFGLLTLKKSYQRERRNQRILEMKIIRIKEEEKTRSSRQEDEWQEFKADTMKQSELQKALEQFYEESAAAEASESEEITTFDKMMMKVSQSVFDQDIRLRVAGSFGAMTTVLAYMNEIEQTRLQ